MCSDLGQVGTKGALDYMKTVLTVGVFDLLHWGHFELFRRAKELAGEGGRLVVATLFGINRTFSRVLNVE